MADVDQVLRREWDAIVVGGGMGGAMAAAGLADAGLSVLVVERGDAWPLPGDGDGWSHQPVEVTVDGRRTFEPLPVGSGLGGSTALYQAQLERFRPIDFTPGEWPGTDHAAAAVPDRWPVGYDEMVPYYERAERMLGVRGGVDPTLPDGTPGSMPLPPPLAPHDERWLEAFARAGLQPYLSHVASACGADCDGCLGRRCEPGGRTGDVARTVLAPRIAAGTIAVLTECSVDRVLADEARVTGLEATVQGRPISLQARSYLLAAGAYATPALLLSSASSVWPDGVANSSGLVGRHLMVHVSDWLAVRPKDAGLLGPSPIKTISSTACYLHADRKLGAFQSVGLVVDADAFEDRYVEYLRARITRGERVTRKLVRLLARASARRYAGAKGFATIVEDFPYPDNRVIADSSVPGAFRVEYHWRDELQERSALLVRAVRSMLGGQFRMARLSGRDTLNYAHACGTCRAADDPAAGVVDRDNRCHDVGNLFVVDASFFPTSGGINPALTIGANALRVADVIVRDHGSTGSTVT